MHEQKTLYLDKEEYYITIWIIVNETSYINITSNISETTHIESFHFGSAFKSELFEMHFVTHGSHGIGITFDYFS